MKSAPKIQVIFVLLWVAVSVGLLFSDMGVGPIITGGLWGLLGVPLFEALADEDKKTPRKNSAPASWQWAVRFLMVALTVGSMYAARWLGLPVGVAGVGALVMLVTALTGAWALRKKFPLVE